MISIIIPVYNVEDYLRECLDSIAGQSSDDWEAILVDDGSTDNSLLICNEYAHSNLHYKVFHKENGGVSSARNLGIEKAIGDWIWFVDADDWIEKDSLQILNDVISGYDCDTIFHGLVKVGNNRMIKHKLPYEDFNSHKHIFLEKHFCFQNGMILFNANVINNIGLKYTEGIKMGEDLEFQYKYLIHCKKPISIGCNLYYYRYRDGSATLNSQSLVNNMNNNFQNAFSLLNYTLKRDFIIDTWLSRRIRLILKSAILSASKLGAPQRKYAQSELIKVRRFVKEYNITGIFDCSLLIASFNMNLYSILMMLFLKMRK